MAIAVMIYERYKFKKGLGMRLHVWYTMVASGIDHLMKLKGELQHGTIN